MIDVFLLVKHFHKLDAFKNFLRSIGEFVDVNMKKKEPWRR